MKKLAVFIFVGMLAVCGIFIPKQSIFDIEGACEYCFVASVEAAQESELTFVENGADVIASTTDKVAAKEFYEKNAPKCVVMKFGCENLQKVKDFLKISQSWEQKLQDKEIIYGYTSMFEKCEFVNGKKINVQLVLEGDQLIVGFPLIMTGY